MSKNRLKLCLLFGLGFGVASLIVSWLLLTEKSPFYEFFLWHNLLPNIWSNTLLPAYLFGCVISGNFHSPNEIAMCAASFVQWFFVGCIVSIITIGITNPKQ